MKNFCILGNRQMLKDSTKSIKMDSIYFHSDITLEKKKQHRFYSKINSMVTVTKGTESEESIVHEMIHTLY